MDQSPVSFRAVVGGYAVTVRGEDAGRPMFDPGAAYYVVERPDGVELAAGVTWPQAMDLIRTDRERNPPPATGSPTAPPTPPPVPKPPPAPTRPGRTPAAS